MIIVKSILFFAIVSFFLLVNLSYAQVWVSDSYGVVKRDFYQNDTVYITSDCIFNASKSYKVYIVNNNGTWRNQTSLLDASGGPKNVTTNVSGCFNRVDVWKWPLTIGTYDLVVDVDGDGVYDAGTCGTDDCNTTMGFQVFRTPKPIIAVSHGPKHPPNHDWTYDPNNAYNTMMQLQVLGDIVETTAINSIYLSALGSGNDKTGIFVIRVILDENENGVFDSGEKMIAYGNFVSDNGIAILSLREAYTLPANKTVQFLIIYTMTDQIKAGDTYAAHVVTIDAMGQDTKAVATVNNLPLMTSTKTVVGSSQTTTVLTTAQTTAATTTVQTTIAATTVQTTAATTVKLDECNKDEDCEAGYCKDYKCVEKPFEISILIIAIVIVVAIISVVAIIFMRRKPKIQYEYSAQRYS